MVANYSNGAVFYYVILIVSALMMGAGINSQARHNGNCLLQSSFGDTCSGTAALAGINVAVVLVVALLRMTGNASKATLQLTMYLSLAMALQSLLISSALSNLLGIFCTAVAPNGLLNAEPGAPRCGQFFLALGLNYYFMVYGIVFGWIQFVFWVLHARREYLVGLSLASPKPAEAIQ